MGPNINALQSNEGQGYPVGYENWSMEKKQDFKNHNGIERTTLIKKAKMFGAGAGIGLLTEFSKQILSGSEGESHIYDHTEQPKIDEPKKGDVSENMQNQSGGGFESNRVPRANFESGVQNVQTTTEQVPVTTEQTPKPSVFKSVGEDLKEKKIDTTPKSVEAQVALFEDLSVLRHEVVAGDSTWEILKKILENNERFVGMTEAQKTYILNALTNKVLEEPMAYGLNKDGTLQIGNRVDFSKLFSDTDKVREIFAEAQRTVVPGSAQEKSILMHNGKIATWIHKNPGVGLTPEKVSEILNTEIEKPLSEEPKPKIPEVKAREQFEKEIDDAKQRLATLTGGGGGVAPKIPGQKTDYGNIKKADGGLRTFGTDTEFLKTLEINFRNEIDHIYGERGLLGLRKIEGVDTKNWGFMKKMDASEVLNYFRNPGNSNLPPKVLAELKNSEKHRALVEHLDGLLNNTDGGVKPYENGETMEDFIKRLGSFLMRKTK